MDVGSEVVEKGTYIMLRFSAISSPIIACTMSSSDSVSVFAEGTFQEQLQELIEYTARGSSDDERATLLQSFKDLAKTEPLEEDTRRAAFELVLKNIKGLGQGADQGMPYHDRCVFF